MLPDLYEHLPHMKTTFDSALGDKMLGRSEDDGDSVAGDSELAQPTGPPTSYGAQHTEAMDVDVENPTAESDANLSPGYMWWGGSALSGGSPMILKYPNGDEVSRPGGYVESMRRTIWTLQPTRTPGEILKMRRV